MRELVRQVLVDERHEINGASIRFGVEDGKENERRPRKGGKGGGLTRAGSAHPSAVSPSPWHRITLAVVVRREASPSPSPSGAITIVPSSARRVVVVVACSALLALAARGTPRGPRGARERDVAKRRDGRIVVSSSSGFLHAHAIFDFDCLARLLP